MAAPLCTAVRTVCRHRLLLRHSTARLVAVLLACSLLTACSSDTSPEQQIIDTIKAMEEAGEAGQLITLMSHVHESFTAQQGSLPRERFRGYLLLQLNRHERIRAQLFPIEVHLFNAEEAVAEFNALMTGGRGLFPEQGRLIHFETVWRLNDGDWQLLAANWKRAGR